MVTRTIGGALGGLVGVGMVVSSIVVLSVAGSFELETASVSIDDVALPLATVLVGLMCGGLFAPWLEQSDDRVPVGLVVSMALAAVLLGDLLVTLMLAAGSTLDATPDASAILGTVAGMIMLFLYGLVLFGWWLALPLTLVATLVWLILYRHLRPPTSSPLAPEPSRVATSSEA